MKRIIVATKNQGKIREFEQRLAQFDYRIKSLKDLDKHIEVVEDCDTFEGNAVKKARAVSEVFRCPTLSDDSGLEVDALNGGPGVHSARYGGPGLDDRGRYTLLLEELRDTAPAARTARFRAAIAYIAPGESPLVFHGTLEGTIAFTPSGTHGFGYDPVFIPAGHSQTLAELGLEVKDRISHRARALDAFMKAIQEGKVL